MGRQGVYLAGEEVKTGSAAGKKDPVPHQGEEGVTRSEPRTRGRPRKTTVPGKEKNMMQYQMKKAEFLARCEKKLPRPENYRKKTTDVLRRTLSRINEDSKALAEVPEFVSLCREHRRHILKVLTSRVAVKGG